MHLCIHRADAVQVRCIATHAARLASNADELVTRVRAETGLELQVITAEQEADLVALGRALLYDPRWPWHAADKLGVPLTYAPPYRGEYPNMRSTDRLKAGAQK